MEPERIGPYTPRRRRWWHRFTSEDEDAERSRETVRADAGMRTMNGLR